MKEIDGGEESFTSLMANGIEEETRFTGHKKPNTPIILSLLVLNSILNYIFFSLIFESNAYYLSLFEGSHSEQNTIQTFQRKDDEIFDEWNPGEEGIAEKDNDRSLL